MIEYPFNVDGECGICEASLEDIKDPKQYPKIVENVENDPCNRNSFIKEAAYEWWWKQNEEFRQKEIKKIKRKKLAVLSKRINQKRSNCKSKNIPFDLDLEWYVEGLKQGCALTKLPFDLFSDIYDKKNGPYSPYQPSIDRIDPDKGYLKNNCRVILFSLNLFKLHFTDAHMYKISEKLLENRFNPD